MIPVVDAFSLTKVDCRDVCANVMLLTDDEETNDAAGWIALALTGIGFIPVFGSAIKGYIVSSRLVNLILSLIGTRSWLTKLSV